jgi:hypothetical protein
MRIDGACGRGRRAVGAVVLTVAAALLAGSLAVPPAAAGTYDDPYYLGWPAFVPAVGGDFTATTENDCPTGSLKCVDNVIKEMTRRFNKLGCHHDSAFAFTYLLTTQEYRRAVEDPNFFTDNAFVNHQDQVFAEYYFQNHDDWRRGRIDRVSPAWRVAFDAADRQQVTGMGNILLGMNGHVNRDLPFVLHAIGLVKPDGTTRKVDHDRVNAFLNAVNKYLLNEAAKYLDPTIDDGDVPGTTIDNSAMVQLLFGWREQAWRNAERLAAAPDDDARLAVAQEIENAAALEATLLKTAYSYKALGPLALNGTAKARNDFCASHWQAR